MTAKSKTKSKLNIKEKRIKGLMDKGYTFEAAARKLGYINAIKK